MPSVRTVKSWGFQCVGYECEDGEVVKIWCKICMEFYSENTTNATGFMKGQVQKYVTGTDVVKKNNFADHIKNSVTYQTALRRLNEKNKTSQASSSNTTSGQQSVVTCLQNANTKQKEQLIKKFQLAHFIAAKGKSFNLYSEIANFEQNYHDVKLGSGFLTDTACKEILTFISKSIVEEKIENPFKEMYAHFYLIHNDGSSSAKTMDEKELYIIKMAPAGKVVFEILSLEQPEEATAEGLKSALENGLTKVNLAEERQKREIGLCTDGAAVNKKLHSLVKADLGEHYMLTLCPAHKMESAIRDAFETSQLDKDCSQEYTTIFYLFKRANLRWRLFKRQALFEGIEYRRYKRPAGTRWVEHQSAALKSHLHNLKVLIGFCNQQIAEPHNASMKKIKDTLIGVKKNVCRVDRIIFEAIKNDILSLLEPVSKVMQESTVLLPRFITICSQLITRINKMKWVLLNKEKDAFLEGEIFETAAQIMKEIDEEPDEIVPERQTRANDISDSCCKYHGFLLTGSVEKALERCHNEFLKILEALTNALEDRLSPITESPLYKAIAVVLDTRSYSLTSVDVIYDEIEVIANHFKPVLEKNGCNFKNLKAEIDIAHDHISKFLPNHNAVNCWPLLFNLKHELGISNLLLIIELSLVTLLSNAECERAFSFLWRILSKERTSLKNDTLEMLLRMKNDQNVSKSRYESAVSKFLTEYPNGCLRERKRRLNGHNYPSYRKSKEKKVSSIGENIDNYSESSNEDKYPQVSDIPFGEISDSKWSDDSDNEDL